MSAFDVKKQINKLSLTSKNQPHWRRKKTKLIDISQQDTTVAWSRGILRRSPVRKFSKQDSIKPEPASNGKIRMRSPSSNAIIEMVRHVVCPGQNNNQVIAHGIHVVSNYPEAFSYSGDDKKHFPGEAV